MQLHQVVEPPHEKSARARVVSMLEAGAPASRIAVEAGIRLMHLQSWLDGKEHPAELEQRITNWLEESDARNDEVEPGFVETETSNKINSALEYARVRPTIALIYGAPGLGKTTAVKRYCEGFSRRPILGPESAGGLPSAFYVCASPCVKTPTQILHAVAEKVGCYVEAYRNDPIARYILKRIAPGDIFIVDEAQHLDAAALDLIRYFFDEGNIGVAYVGNETVAARFSGRGRYAMFAQLSSRVGRRLPLTTLNESDVDAVLEAWHVRGAQERTYAIHIASGPGGLRILTHVLHISRIIAGLKRRPIDLQIMRASARQSGNDE